MTTEALPNDLHPYPNDPTPAVKKVIEHVRGINVQPAVELAHCGWHLVGVAMSYADPHPVAEFSADKPKPLVALDDSTADLLERHLLPADGPLSDADNKAIPWDVIYQIALLLIELFRKR